MKKLIIKFYRDRKKVRKIKFIGVFHFDFSIETNILTIFIIGQKIPTKIVINNNEYIKMRLI